MRLFLSLMMKKSYGNIRGNFFSNRMVYKID